MTISALFPILSFWIAITLHPVNNPFPNDPDKKDPGQWKDARTSGGVQTYFRWINSDGVSFRERRGEMDIDCSLPEAVRIISDAQYTNKWMSGIDESKNLNYLSKNEWYTYTIFSIPWPFSKRDLVSLNQMTADPAQGVTTINVICKEKYVPLKPDIMRLDDYRAQWKFTKTGDNKIHLTFLAASSAPPAFPRYIQDPVIERMFHNNLVRLKELLQE